MAIATLSLLSVAKVARAFTPKRSILSFCFRYIFFERFSSSSFIIYKNLFTQRFTFFLQQRVIILYKRKKSHGQKNVSTKFLREHVSTLPTNSISSRSCWSTQRFHILSFGLLQVRDMRYQINPQDILQQSAHDQRQRSVLQ